MSCNKFGGLLLLCLLGISNAVPDFKFTIKEEARIGLDVGDLSSSATFYANMSAVEKASLRFGILNKYREPASLFTIGEQNGVLKVKGRIDREFLCDYSGPCVLEFDVAVHSESSFSNIAGVQVTVLDINDNEPSFPANEVLLEVSEGAKVGKEFKITGAADSDSLEEYKIQKYGLTLQENIFSLTSTKNSDGSSVINLRLETPLDREKKNNYSFNIVATDGGNPPKTGTIRVKITVTDENDNPPVFTNSTYILNIKEDTPINFSVLQLKAIDLDIGQNGKVRYDFSPLQSAKGRSMFNVDALSGNLTVAGDLSYEAGTSQDLYIVALDGGSPPLKTQKKVRVNILDNGNNPPRVTMTTLSTGETDVMEIPESATVGFFVAFVEVEDSDPGQSGQFECKTSDTSIFKLEIQAGKGYKVLLNTVLNRETQDSYDLRVTCTDQGEPPMSSTATLSLLVTDVNDKAPVFSHKIYNATIAENNSIGDFLVTVTATDDDIGVNAEIDYSIAGNDRRIVVSSTGVISAHSVFDREEDSKITFSVLATDRGSPTLVGSAQVVVNILDKNDNRPAFVKPFYQMEIPENEVPGTSIGQIKAEDFDALQNGQIEYFMAGSEGGVVPFEVLANGTVRSTKMLNREHDNKYTFTALARDKGSKPLTNSVDVIVTVKDINDNKPVVLFPTSGNHTVLISAFPESKSVIGKIIAYDEDSQENSKLHFSIVEGNDQGVFEIGDESGEIMVVSNWKLESDHIYDLTIKVRDSGNPVLFDTTKLRVEASFDNITLGDAVSVKSDKYIVIAATVAGATCVLSLIIITAICLVLRGEKRKATAQPKQLDTVFDNVPVINGDKSTTHGLYGDVESDPRGRGFDGSKTDIPGKKKEVSFSLDESTEAKDNLYHPTPTNITLSRAGLMPTHNLNLHNDDIHSDTSGETITSDSGRGGSEEEVNLHPISEKKHQWQAPVSSNRNSSFDQYYRDGSIGDYRNKPGQPRFVVSNNNSANNSSYRQDKSFNRPKSNSSYSTATSGRGTSQESFRDFSNPRTMLLPYNTQLSNMSHDDDASTTTSGSYTISPDEHFHDIVLQKDVIV